MKSRDYLIIYAIWIAFAYGGMSFIKWQPNVSEWGIPSRFILVFVSLAPLFGKIINSDEISD